MKVFGPVEQPKSAMHIGSVEVAERVLGSNLLASARWIKLLVASTPALCGYHVVNQIISHEHNFHYVTIIYVRVIVVNITQTTIDLLKICSGLVESQHFSWNQNLTDIHGL